jgi:hypothetical protein
VAACALGMGTKAVMVTAPLLVLIYDRVFLSDSLAAVFRRRGALYAGLFGTLLILGATGIAGIVLNPARSTDLTLGIGYAGSTPLEYALTQPGVILHYLRLTLWPHPLCLDYAWPLAKSARAIVPPVLIVGALLAATIASFRRWPALGFAGAWFFIVLAPTSSVIPVADVAFEHRMYLPLAGVIAVVAAAFTRLLNARARACAIGPCGADPARPCAVAAGAGCVDDPAPAGLPERLRRVGGRGETAPGELQGHHGLSLALSPQARRSRHPLPRGDRLAPDYPQAQQPLRRWRKGRLDDAIWKPRGDQLKGASAWRTTTSAAPCGPGPADRPPPLREAIRGPFDVEARNNLGIALPARGSSKKRSPAARRSG